MISSPTTLSMPSLPLPLPSSLSLCHQVWLQEVVQVVARNLYAFSFYYLFISAFICYTIKRAVCLSCVLENTFRRVPKLTTFHREFASCRLSAQCSMDFGVSVSVYSHSVWLYHCCICCCRCFLFVLQITNIINWWNHSAACLARLKVLKNSTSIIAINNMLSKYLGDLHRFSTRVPRGATRLKKDFDFMCLSQ